MYRQRIADGVNDVNDALVRYSPPERLVILRESLENALQDAAAYEKDRLESLEEAKAAKF